MQGIFSGLVLFHGNTTYLAMQFENGECEHREQAHRAETGVNFRMKGLQEDITGIQIPVLRE